MDATSRGFFCGGCVLGFFSSAEQGVHCPPVHAQPLRQSEAEVQDAAEGDGIAEAVISADSDGSRRCATCGCCAKR
jgi:hypothetical protein